MNFDSCDVGEDGEQNEFGFVEIAGGFARQNVILFRTSLFNGVQPLYQLVHDGSTLRQTLASHQHN